jgi:hypothetical protein
MGRPRPSSAVENITKGQISESNNNRMRLGLCWNLLPTTCGTTQELEEFPSRWEEAKVAARVRLLEEAIREPMQDLVEA